MTTTETKATHTPGPLKVEPRTGYVPPSDLKYIITKGAMYTALVPTEADAVLYAAAPELLAACKELCRRLECNELVNRPDNPCNQYDQPAYDAALKAIAKAEGR